LREHPRPVHVHVKFPPRQDAGVSIQLTLSQDAGQQVPRNGWETRVQNRQQTQYGTCMHFLGPTQARAHRKALMSRRVTPSRSTPPTILAGTGMWTCRRGLQCADEITSRAACPRASARASGGQSWACTWGPCGPLPGRSQT
jgi:hypothetical protein